MTIDRMSRSARVGLAGAAASAVLTIPLSGCVFAASKQSATTTASRSVAGVTMLQVENRNGAVTVSEDATAAGLEVRAEIRCWAATQQEADDRAKAARLVTEVEPNGKGLVRVEFPEPKSSQDSATIEIRVGALVDLDLRTTNGAITVSGFNCPLEARTSNGAVETSGHSGTSSIETSNGRIVVQSAGGPVDATTSNGRVEVVLAPGNASSVDASTSNGSIEIVADAAWIGTVTGNTSNGRVTLDVPDGTGKSRRVSGTNAATTSVGQGDSTIKARTSNGTVTVRVGG